MGLLDAMFPRQRPRRRRAAAVGSISILGLAGVFLMRTFTGKDAGAPCHSTNDCGRAFICAESTEEAGKKRGDGIMLCAKPCMSDADCTSPLTCTEAKEHTVGPRGGAHENRAKACLAPSST
jgi:hypothetical protein